MRKRHSALVLVIGLVIFAIGCWLLVMNRQQAASMAKAIVAKDNKGETVTADQAQLEAYAKAHMKVNVSYKLQGSYDRAVVQAKADAAKASTAATYAAAQQSCDKKGVDSIRQARCVSAYLAAHATAANPVVLPDEAKYRFSAVGPFWNVSIAGILLAAGVVVTVAAIVLIIARAFSSQE